MHESYKHYDFHYNSKNIIILAYLPKCTFVLDYLVESSCLSFLCYNKFCSMAIKI